MLCPALPNDLVLTPDGNSMTTPCHMPARKTIVLVGLVGCFLTSVAGITGAMLISGWAASGGWLEWSRRLAWGYPCACGVVVGVFPVLVPWLTRRLEAQADTQPDRPSEHR